MTEFMKKDCTQKKDNICFDGFCLNKKHQNKHRKCPRYLCGEKKDSYCLAHSKIGTKLIVESIRECRKVAMRITELGIRKGDEIEILSKQGFGRCIVLAEDKRITIGQGLAHNIMVFPA